jgi:hypothetical protein
VGFARLPELAPGNETVGIAAALEGADTGFIACETLLFEEELAPEEIGLEE